MITEYLGWVDHEVPWSGEHGAPLTGEHRVPWANENGLHCIDEDETHVWARNTHTYIQNNNNKNKSELITSGQRSWNF